MHKMKGGKRHNIGGRAMKMEMEGEDMDGTAMEGNLYMYYIVTVTFIYFCQVQRINN